MYLLETVVVNPQTESWGGGGDGVSTFLHMLCRYSRGNHICTHIYGTVAMCILRSRCVIFTKFSASTVQYSTVLYCRISVVFVRTTTQGPVLVYHTKTIPGFWDLESTFLVQLLPIIHVESRYILYMNPNRCQPLISIAIPVIPTTINPQL